MQQPAPRLYCKKFSQEIGTNKEVNGESEDAKRTTNDWQERTELITQFLFSPNENFTCFINFFPL